MSRMSTTATATKVTPNEYGVSWSPSRSGKIQIALRQVAHEWQIWGLYTGTHDLAPVTRNFRDETAARNYANTLWRTK